MDESLIAQGEMVMKKLVRGAIIAVVIFFLFKMQTHFQTGHYWVSALAGLLSMMTATALVPQLLMTVLIGSALMSQPVTAALAAWLKSIG